MCYKTCIFSFPVVLVLYLLYLILFSPNSLNTGPALFTAACFSPPLPVSAFVHSTSVPPCATFSLALISIVAFFSS